jgi:type IV secretory pathway TraG/TraD family ATPase VirD4
MQRQLMILVVTAVCHVLIPLVLALLGCVAFAILIRSPLWRLAAGVGVGLAAWFTARNYTFYAIGPCIADRDHPATWSFLGNRILNLAKLSLITPAVVAVVSLLAKRHTPLPVAISLAILLAIVAQWFVCFLLERDTSTWTHRVRRGRVILTPEQIQENLSQLLLGSGGNPVDLIRWAGMDLPRSVLAPHTKILGMTRSGKTVAIRLMLQSLVERCSCAANLKIVVFDPKRELYTYLLGMDPRVPVFLLDPTDRRGVAWDLAADITDPNLAKVVARLLVPEEHSSQPYFARSARRILESVIRYLIVHAKHWNLQDVFMILDDLELLKRILPRQILTKYFKPEATLKNTLSTLDTLTSRFETVAACWAQAEQEGRTLSLAAFEASRAGAILVIPRRHDIADAVDPTIRLVFERLIHLFLSRPDTRFLPPDLRPETHILLDEVAKAGNLTRLDDLLLMGGAKGAYITIAGQDVEAIRQEYGQKTADSLLAQCGNTAVFTLESPETRDYCASLFGTHEIRERPVTVDPSSMQSALTMQPKDLYHPGELREHKTLLPAEFAVLSLPQITGKISGYHITGGLGAHFASYPFAHLLLPPAPDPDLVPRDKADQESPERLSEAQRRRLGLPDPHRRVPASAPPEPQPSPPPPPIPPSSTDSLRFIKRIT